VVVLGCNFGRDWTTGTVVRRFPVGGGRWCEAALHWVSEEMGGMKWEGPGLIY